MEKFCKQSAKNRTLAFYNNAFADYKARVQELDLSEHYAWVFQYLDPTKVLKVLDLGCGPGRDTAFFMGKGFDVLSVDASYRMIELVSQCNPNSILMDIEDLCFEDRFDLVWASASLLHLDKSSLFPVLVQIRNALREHGVLYASFKIGQGDYVDDKQRFFNLVTLAGLKDMIDKIDGFEFLDGVEREDLSGGGVKWVNILVRKNFQPIKSSR